MSFRTPSQRLATKAVHSMLSDGRYRYPTFAGSRIRRSRRSKSHALQFRRLALREHRKLVGSWDLRGSRHGRGYLGHSTAQSCPQRPGSVLAATSQARTRAKRQVGSKQVFFSWLFLENGNRILSIAGTQPHFYALSLNQYSSPCKSLFSFGIRAIVSLACRTLTNLFTTSKDAAA